MAFLDIGGFIFTAISGTVDLINKYKDFTTWTEIDTPVDNEWLNLAIKDGIMDTNAEYVWVNVQHVPTYQLKKSHEVAYLINSDKKVKSRIIQGNNPPNILMRKIKHT